MGYVSQTYADDMGTADLRRCDPASEQAFHPLTTMVLDFLSDLLDLPEDDKICYFDLIRGSMDGFLDGRNFITTDRPRSSIEDAPSGSVLEDLAQRVLDPTPPPGTREVYGPLTQLLSAYPRSRSQPRCGCPRGLLR